MTSGTLAPHRNPGVPVVHIQFIAAGGGEGGYQVRAGSGRTGQTRFFAVRKYGGYVRALRAAARYALALLPPESLAWKARRNANNRSRVPSMAVRWRAGRRGAVYPYVCGHWRDARGRHRSFSYSIEHHGLREAVELALARQRASGVAVPSVDEAVQRLRGACPALGAR